MDKLLLRGRTPHLHTTIDAYMYVIARFRIAFKMYPNIVLDKPCFINNCNTFSSFLTQAVIFKRHLIMHITYSLRISRRGICIIPHRDADVSLALFLCRRGASGDLLVHSAYYKMHSSYGFCRLATFIHIISEKIAFEAFTLSAHCLQLSTSP